MPTDYVSDYEAVTGQKVPASVEIKVIGSPFAPVVEPATVAETPETVDSETFGE